MPPDIAKCPLGCQDRSLWGTTGFPKILSRSKYVKFRALDFRIVKILRELSLSSRRRKSETKIPQDPQESLSPAGYFSGEAAQAACSPCGTEGLGFWGDAGGHAPLAPPADGQHAGTTHPPLRHALSTSVRSRYHPPPQGQ